MDKLLDNLGPKKVEEFNYNLYPKPSMYKTDFDELEMVMDDEFNYIPVGYHEWDSLKV